MIHKIPAAHCCCVLVKEAFVHSPQDWRGRTKDLLFYSSCYIIICGHFLATQFKVWFVLNFFFNKILLIDRHSNSGEHQYLDDVRISDWKSVEYISLIHASTSGTKQWLRKEPCSKTVLCLNLASYKPRDVPGAHRLVLFLDTCRMDEMH